MNILADRTDYRTYVVQAMSEATMDERTKQWKYALFNVQTGQRQGFATLDALFAALVDQLVVPQPIVINEISYP